MSEFSKRLSDLKSSTAGPLGGSTDQPMMIQHPLVMMFEQNDKLICHLHPGDYDHKHYGLIICDLVRHISKAFKVDEDEVWKWVDKERDNPTSDLTQTF